VEVIKGHQTDSLDNRAAKLALELIFKEKPKAAVFLREAARKERDSSASAQRLNEMAGEFEPSGK
jgi:hypothetical protein